MWRRHRSTLKDHVKQIQNDIVKNLIVDIIQYAESVSETHDLAKYLPPPSTTENSTRIILALQLRTYFQHPCRINWRSKMKIITTCPTKDGMSFYPEWRKNITESKPVHDNDSY